MAGAKAPRAQAVLSPEVTAEPLRAAVLTFLHWGHTTRWEHRLCTGGGCTALCRERFATSRRNTMLEWSVLQLSSTRDDHCPWGTAEAELGGSGRGSSVQPGAAMALCCHTFRSLQQWAGKPLVLSPAQNTSCLTQ